MFALSRVSGQRARLGVADHRVVLLAGLGVRPKLDVLGVPVLLGEAEEVGEVVHAVVQRRTGSPPPHVVAAWHRARHRRRAGTASVVPVVGPRERVVARRRSTGMNCGGAGGMSSSRTSRPSRCCRSSCIVGRVRFGGRSPTGRARRGCRRRGRSRGRARQQQILRVSVLGLPHGYIVQRVQRRVGREGLPARPGRRGGAGLSSIVTVPVYVRGAPRRRRPRSRRPGRSSRPAGTPPAGA